MLSSRRTVLEARLARKETSLENAYTTYDALKDGTVAAFELDTGEAKQRITKKNINKLADHIDRLEKQIDQINRSLNGCNAIRFVANRRG